jgi:hypothetical protein
MPIRRECARPWPPAALLLPLLLSLQGCSDVTHFLSPAPPPPPPALPLPPKPPAHPPPVAARPAVVPPTAPVASQPLAAPPPPSPPPSPPIVLVGLAPPDVMRLFGAPASRSPTGQGERWTYHSGPCQLDLFIFPDVSSGAPAVLDQRIAADPSGPAAEQACLRTLRDDHAP